MALKVEEILRKIEELDRELGTLEDKRKVLAAKIDEVIERYRRALNEELARELEKVLAEYGEKELKAVEEEVERIRREAAQRRETLWRAFEEKKERIISSVVRQLLG